MDDGTSVDSEIAFYPRPPPQKTSSPSTVEPVRSLISALPSQDDDDDEVEQMKVHDLVNHTIKFFNNNSSEDDLGSGGKEPSTPVMITIGNPGGPIYEKIPADPEKSLFPKKGPHHLGIESMWVQMGGGTIAYQSDKESDNSIWSHFAASGPKKEKDNRRSSNASTVDNSPPVFVPTSTSCSGSGFNFAYPMAIPHNMYPMPPPYYSVPVPTGGSTNSAEQHHVPYPYPYPGYAYPYPYPGYPPPGYPAPMIPSFDPRVHPQVAPSTFRWPNGQQPNPESFESHHPSYPTSQLPRPEDGRSTRRVNTIDVPQNK